MNQPNPVLSFRSSFTRHYTAVAAAVMMAFATLVATGPAQAAGNQSSGFSWPAPVTRNPGVIPNVGDLYGQLGAKWWQWAFSFPARSIPFFNGGGHVDVSAGQSGPVWFLAGANGGLARPRTGVVPAGVSLFLPMANLINDYPCPASFGFEPNSGEALEDFLQRTADDFFPYLTDLFAEVDGIPLRHLESYRAMSSMFRFKADAAATSFDPCITGTSQYGVAVGYWLLLAPLPPGTHTLHFGARSWGQDVTYVLNVTPFVYQVHPVLGFTP